MSGKPRTIRRAAAVALLSALTWGTMPGTAAAVENRFDAGPAADNTSHIALDAQVWFTRGEFVAELAWSGIATPQAEVRRDGEVLATVADATSYLDELGKPRNGASFAYQVCEVGSDACSQVVTVVTDRRGGPPRPPGQPGPEPSLDITTTELPPLNLFESFEATLTAAHGEPPYLWSATGLPAGLTLDPVTGVISNDPAAPAVTTVVDTVTVTVTDSTGATAEAVLPVDAITAAKLAAGNNHVCAVTTATTVYCWGSNLSGQLGDGTFQDRSLPVPVVDPDDPDTVFTGAADITAGEAHTCVTTVDGAAYCWGFNGAGRLGIGHDNSVELPVPHQVVAPAGAGAHLTEATAISAGSLHTCALTGEGAAYCWGDNFRGQAGSPGHIGGTPTAVVDPGGGSGGLTGLTAIGGGGFHTCAVTTEGTGYCWGWNHVGQLGIDSTFPLMSTTPLVVVDPDDTDEALTGLSHIRGGGVHTCAGTTTGVGYCWGQNAHGQLGNGDAPATSLAPAPVVDPQNPDSPLTNLAAVGPGTIHGCAVTFDETAFCWGNNSEGQLGDGTTDTTDLPTEVADPTDPDQPFSAVAELVHNGWLTCALTTSGVTYCWGHNDRGQLGNGSTDNRLLPTPVHPRL